ncbi:Ser/Thr protein kinase RdoA (MazF antagonist) [Caldalkalibacillus uzonensis]|uniref:Ser/Thr protein kinase RdoA (MazF antagonist) n=1 Tax=Caldalkalibacillus uzonensis TaxID=353224 RepID=A0ABU0CVF9_9BACI|nr:phosphotransferase [Caldalkalibacillus uzonensis]MDQ0339510.1 Ser/Thr protein kinase RdoA (MazF antagonist) [Caldalkalibacillus uzonensis]
MNDTEIKSFKQSFFEGYGKTIKKLDVIRPHRVYVALTDSDCFVVKFLKDADTLNWQGKCIQQLLGKETKGVVPFLYNKYHSVVNTFDGQVYGVMPYIPGKTINLNQSSHIENSLKLLAHVHRQGGGIFGQQPAVPFHSKTYVKWRDRFLQFKRSVRDAAYQDEPYGGVKSLAHLINCLADEALDWAERVLDAFPQAYMLYLEEQAQWERQIAHQDMAPHNFLVIDDQFFYMIDYDRMSYAPPFLDLIHFISMVLPYVRWEYAALGHLLGHYEQYFPLEQEQKRYLPLLLIFPQDVFREWLGVWRREPGYHPGQVLHYFKELEHNWDRRRTFVQHCLAVLK